MAAKHDLRNLRLDVMSLRYGTAFLTLKPCSQLMKFHLHLELKQKLTIYGILRFLLTLHFIS